MVNVPQVQIPDFAASMMRGEQVQQSRLQAMAQRQALQDAARFDSTLAEIAPQLAAGEGAAYDSALGRLAGAGRQGLTMALPMLQDRRQQREAAAFNWGGAPTAPVMGAAPAAGGDPMTRIAAVESGGNDAARNPGSSAAGRFQIIDSTWNQYAPRLGLRPDQRMDPAAQEQVARAIQADAQQAVGRPLSPAESYGAHFLGIGGLRAFLGADPNADAQTVYAQAAGPGVAQQAFQRNPGLLAPGMTVGQVMSALERRMGGGAAPARDPNVTPASGGAPGGAAPSRTGIDPAELRRIEMALASGNSRLEAQARARLQMLQLQQRDPTDSFREETRDIGGRRVQGQVNARTGQFTAYPGQAASSDGLTSAQAAGVVQRLGPRIAAGEIRPDSPEYNDYAIAHALMTRPTLVWVDDPNNPGTQRAIQQPGVTLDPTRFPPPSGGAYGTQPGVATIPTGGGATAPAQAPQAPAPGGVQIGATNMTADPPDASAANPTALTRQSPNTTPTGEENLSAGYARRMVEAETLLARAVQGGYNPGNLRDALAGGVAGGQNAGTLRRAAGNAAMSDQGQLYRQAQEDWVRAKLRRESGAVIGEDEMAREIQVYFPQPGDSQAVIAQKAEARRVAIDAMRQASGRASTTVPREGAPADPAQRRRAEEAIARARRELGANATEDAILQRAAGFMR